MRVHAVAQHSGVRLRRKRQPRVVVLEEESFGVESQPNLLRLQRLAVGLAEDRQENFVDGLTARGDRVPIDIEVMQESGVGPVFQNAHPPGVVRTGRHVIGDNIEQQTEVALMEFVMQRREVLVASQLRIECRRVDDVISVRAPLPRLENRRGIEVAHTEFGEVGNDPPGVSKREAGVELQAVGGSGDAVHLAGALQMSWPFWSAVPWHRFLGRGLPRPPAASCRLKSGGEPPHSIR